MVTHHRTSARTVGSRPLAASCTPPQPRSLQREEKQFENFEPLKFAAKLHVAKSRQVNDRKRFHAALEKLRKKYGEKVKLREKFCEEFLQVRRPSSRES